MGLEKEKTGEVSHVETLLPLCWTGSHRESQGKNAGGRRAGEDEQWNTSFTLHQDKILKTRQDIT